MTPTPQELAEALALADEAVRTRRAWVIVGSCDIVAVLAAALAFEDFNSKENMMCGWRKVHRELYVVARAYRALLASKNERLAAMEGALKDIHAMVRSAHSPRWEAVGDIAKKALASPPQPAPRQENSDG